MERQLLPVKSAGMCFQENPSGSTPLPPKQQQQQQNPEPGHPAPKTTAKPQTWTSRTKNNNKTLNPDIPHQKQQQNPKPGHPAPKTTPKPQTRTSHTKTNNKTPNPDTPHQRAAESRLAQPFPGHGAAPGQAAHPGTALPDFCRSWDGGSALGSLRALCRWRRGGRDQIRDVPVLQGWPEPRPNPSAAGQGPPGFPGSRDWQHRTPVTAGSEGPSWAPEASSRTRSGERGQVRAWSNLG